MTSKQERSLFVVGLRLWFFMAMISTFGAISFIVITVIVTNPVLLLMTSIGLMYTYRRGHLQRIHRRIWNMNCLKKFKTAVSDASL